MLSKDVLLAKVLHKYLVPSLTPWSVSRELAGVCGYCEVLGVELLYTASRSHTVFTSIHGPVYGGWGVEQPFFRWFWRALNWGEGLHIGGSPTRGMATLVKRKLAPGELRPARAGNSDRSMA